jgi:hypothetical protein
MPAAESELGRRILRPNLSKTARVCRYVHGLLPAEVRFAPATSGISTQDYNLAEPRGLTTSIQRAGSEVGDCFRVADHPGVIAWWLKAKPPCGATYTDGPLNGHLSLKELLEWARV